MFVIQRILESEGKLTLLEQNKVIKPNVTKKKNPLVVGVASDAAFGFYYPDDLEEIERQGCRVKKIDLIREARLPTIDGLFIGGGFPETQAQKLQQNNSMKKLDQLTFLFLPYLNEFKI